MLQNSFSKYRKLPLIRPGLTHLPKRFYQGLYCEGKKDTKERYWGQQFCQMERDISVRPTKKTGSVKGDLKYSGWTEPK